MVAIISEVYCQGVNTVLTVLKRFRVSEWGCPSTKVNGGEGLHQAHDHHVYYEKDLAA